MINKPTQNLTHWLVWILTFAISAAIFAYPSGCYAVAIFEPIPVSSMIKFFFGIFVGLGIVCAIGVRFFAAPAKFLQRTTLIGGLLYIGINYNAIFFCDMVWDSMTSSCAGMMDITSYVLTHVVGLILIAISLILTTIPVVIKSRSRRKLAQS